MAASGNTRGAGRAIFSTKFRLLQKRRRHAAGYMAETLESRRLLAAVNWTGLAGDNLWTNPANWSSNPALPGAADDVTISVAGTPTITLNSGTQTIKSLISDENLTISAGTLSIAAASTLNATTVFSGGTLSGTGNVTINSTLNWSAGTMSGAGRTIIASGATVNISGTATKNLSRTLDNGGTFNYFSPASSFVVVAGFNNLAAGIFNVSADDNMTGFGGFPSFTNAGTLNKSGSGTYRIGEITFSNTGTINIDAGQLTLAAIGGSNTGTFAVDAGATLRLEVNTTYGGSSSMTGAGTLNFIGGTHAFPAGTFTPTGTVNLTGGTITVNNTFVPTTLGTISANVTLNAPQSFASATLTGTLAGSGDVTFTGTLSWNAGTMSGSGKTIIANTGTLSMSGGGTKQLNRILQNDGTTNWTSGAFQMANGTFNNNASFNSNSASTLTSSGSGGTNAFNNNPGATFTKVGAGNNEFIVSTTAVPFNNSGAVNVQAGTLTLSGGVTQHVGTTLTAGAWNVTNATLNITTGSNITANQGIVTLSGSTSIFAKINTLTTNTGTFTLAGGRDFTASPTGGTFTNSGTLNLGAGSVLSVNGAFTQPGSAINVDIAGPVAGTDFGQVVATGAVDLNGTLNANLIGGYDPGVNVSFPVVVGSSRTGTFSAFGGSGFTPGGRLLKDRYDATSAIVSVRPLSGSAADLDAATDSGISAADDLTNDNTPTFTGTASEGTTARIYADGVLVGSGPIVAGAWSVTTSVLADGPRVITATIVDADGDESSISGGPTVTIDTVAPAQPGAIDLQTSSDSGVSGTDNITNINTPAFDLASTDTYHRIERNAVQITGDYATGTTLADGALADNVYSYVLRAVDAAGNASTPSGALVVTIDTTAPAAPVAPDLQAGSDSGVSSTDNITNDNTPSIDFASTDTYHRITRNAVQITGDYDTGTSLTESALADGSYAYVIRGVDAAGNVSAPSPTLMIAIDTIAPATPIAPDLQASSDSGISNTDNITNDTTPTYDVASTDAFFRIEEDGFGMTSGLYESGATFTSPASGDRSTLIRIRGVDAAGNVSAASAGLFFRIDTVAPIFTPPPVLFASSDTGVSSTDRITADNTPTFGVAGDPGDYFQFFREGVQISGDYESGTTYTTSVQPDGTYVYSSRPIDTAGNVGLPSSASMSVTIDTVAPAVPNAPDLRATSDTGVSSTDNITNDNTPTFDVASTDAFYRLFRDGEQVSGDYASGAFTSAVLGDGAYAFSTRAVDAAGNVSGEGSALAVEIDTVGLAAPTHDFFFETGHSMQFAFGEDVIATLANADVLVENVAGGPAIGTALTYSSPTATWTFVGGILPDGNYRATIAAANVTDVAGNSLPADAVLDFFVFAGDANRDRSVDIGDFSILAARFNLPGTFSQGDFNYSGTTDIGDFAILASRFNTGLPAARPGLGVTGRLVAPRAAVADRPVSPSTGRVSVWSRLDVAASDGETLRAHPWAAA
jgi:hypothetical protein